MQRFFLFLITQTICFFVYSQNDKTQTNDNKKDTIYKTKTIISYTFEPPTHYNLIGIMSNFGDAWFYEKNHENPQPFLMPELFCSFNRNSSTFSTSFRYNKINEKVSYNTQHEIISEYSIIEIDTINWYKEIIGNDTITIYISEENNRILIDTEKVDSIRNFNQNQYTISIPLRYGYYLNQGLWRFNFGIGIIPSYNYYEKHSINNKSLLIIPKKQYNIYIEPSFEASYWLFSKIFFHAKIAYSRSAIRYKSINKNNIYNSNIYAGIGISFLFFDKTWE